MNPTSYRLLDLARLLGLALVYFLLAQIALSYAALHHAAVAIIWPSSGLALAALLVFGTKLWPAVFAGAFAAAATVENPIWVSAFIATGNTLEPLVAIWLLARYRFNRTLCTLRDYYLLVLLAVLSSTAISGTIGTGALLLSGSIKLTHLPLSFLHWWMGNMMGALLAVPLLVWWQTPMAWFGRHRTGEIALLLGLSYLYGEVVFQGWQLDVCGPYAQVFLALPLLIWAALRFGRHGVSLLMLLIFAQSLWGLMHSVGYFGREPQQSGLINFWLYQVTLNMAGMTLAVALREHRDVALKLDDDRALLREYLECSPLALGVADIQTRRIVFINHRFVELFGYTMADVPTIDAWYEQAYPDPAYRRRIVAEWTALVEKSQQKGTPIPAYEVQVTCKDGSVRTVEFAGAGPRDHLLVSINDITERKRIEKRERTRNLVLEQMAMRVPLTKVLETIARGVEDDNHSMLCSILLVDREGKHLLIGAAPSLPDFYNTAVDGMAIGPGRGSCGNTAFTGERTVVENVQIHPFWADFAEVASRAGIVSCWSEAIRSSKGEILGTFAIYQSLPKVPDKTDLASIECAAHLVRIAIERQRAEEELHLAGQVYRTASEAIFVTDAQNRIIAANPAFTRLTGYGATEILGQHAGVLDSRINPTAVIGSMGQRFDTGDHWNGELWIQRKNGEAFPAWLTINSLRDERGQVHRHIALFSDITQKKRTEDLIWHQANYDALTNLPNRRLFRDRLLQEIKLSQRAGHALALLLIDLDRFKEVNDTLGHEMGDLLLVEAARRIATCVRETDTVARLGGDEFAAVLPNLADTARVEQVAQAILQVLAEPFQLNQEMADISASIGIALYPSDADDPVGLLRNADQAMFEVKNRGRNGFSYFTRAMQDMAQARMLVIRDLRQAMASGQFEVHYQPIADLKSGRIVKAEALLRWRHPRRGMVDPIEFIAVAEDIGLISEIGDWVFKEAVQQAKRWCTQGNHIPISVNKSPRQFLTGDNHETWLDYIQAVELPSDCIIIEITEGLLLDERAEVRGKLRQFRESGIGISIDDFGTGYSSLAYLKKFAIDYLKIDRSFVRDLTTDPNDRALAEAIVVMAHKLGLKVVAEGVETEAQRDLLAAAGCDYAQGYLYARPLPTSQFDALLASMSE